MDNDMQHNPTDDDVDSSVEQNAIENDPLEDFRSLLNQVQERLEQITENENQFHQWKHLQLEKNRQFWDEYRRQIENYSSNRVRAVQYENYLQHHRYEIIVKRLKMAQFLCKKVEENLISSDTHPYLIPFMSSVESNPSLKNYLLTMEDKRYDTILQEIEIGSDNFSQIEAWSFLDHIEIAN